MAQRYWALAAIALAGCGADDSEDLFGGSGGSGGNGGSAGSAGASASGGSSGSNTAGSGNAGAGAAGSAGTAGTAGGSPADSGSDAACTEKEWCQDVDGDQFGDPTSKKTACDSPGGSWLPNEPATPCTDCFDQSGDVHPGSTVCLVKGYGPSGSFDADCDGMETECKAKAGQCGGALCNQGEGYLPEGPSTINPYCGSKVFQQCSGAAICSATKVDKPNEPMPCR